MNNKFLEYVRSNKARITYMVNNYDWSFIRNECANQGIEFTPMEVKDYIELLRAGLDIIKQYDENEEFPDSFIY